MNEKLFVYGTLKDKKIQMKLLKREIHGIPDILAGYSRSNLWIENNKYPAAIVARKKYIRVMILEITSQELKKIDRFETRAYKRIKIDLKSGTKAWIYIKNTQ